MELNREDSGEMYLPDNQGGYVPESGTQNFSVQGLSDALTSLESEVTVVQPPAEEYTLLLEVTMADQPGCLHPPTFSWNPNHPMPHLVSSESESMLPLVGSAPPSATWMGQVEEGDGCTPRVPTSWLRGRPPEAHLAKDGAGNLLPSSADRGGVNSDGYSTVSETQSTCCHRRKWQGEKLLTPAHLDMLIFKSTDPNTDVTCTLWRFDVQGWLDQYQEEYDATYLQQFERISG